MKFNYRFLTALIIPLWTLWLLENPIKYGLYFFQVILIVLLQLECFSSEAIPKLTLKNPSYFFDYIFIFMSVVLFCFNVYGVPSVFRTILAITISSFLPGYVLLRLIRFKPLFSFIETIILSYGLSLFLTSIISTLLLSLSERQRALIVCLIFIIISTFPLIRRYSAKDKGEQQKFVGITKSPSIKLTEVLLLIAITLFFFFSISTLYPTLAFQNTDTTRHFSESRVISQTPLLYSSSVPFFHVQESTMYILSEESPVFFESLLAYMSILVIFSFYIMTSAYFRKQDSRLPILSTVFFGIFAGFGWVTFLVNKLVESGYTAQFDLLWAAFVRSFFDVGEAVGYLWFEYRPITVGFTCFFIIVYLLKRNDLPRRAFIPIFSFIVVTMGLNHISELVLFIIFFSLFTFFFPKIQLRSKDTFLSIIVGCVIIIVLYPFFISSVLSYIYVYMLALLAISLFSFILMRFDIWKLDFTFTRYRKIFNMLLLLLAVFYVSELLTYFVFAEDFTYSLVYESGFVPLMLYPVLLGVIVLLALKGLGSIKGNSMSEGVKLFLFLSVILFIVGNIVSIINVNYVMTGYFERRFLPLIFSAFCVLASLGFVNIVRNLQKRTFHSIILIGLVVVSGFTSTMLTLELKIEQPKIMPDLYLTEERYETIAAISQAVSKDPTAIIYGFTLNSVRDAEFMGLPLANRYLRVPIWSSTQPEASLTLLYTPQYSPPYLYIPERDINTLPNGYLTEHLVRFIPVVYQDLNANVFRTLNATYPILNSNTILTTSYQAQGNEFFVYDILSLSNCNYTTMIDSDANALSCTTIVIPSDDLSGKSIVSQELINYLTDQTKEVPEQVIILNTNGYGLFADMFYKRENTEVPLGVTLNENGFQIISEDNQTSFWTSRGIDVIGLRGNSGAPILSDDSKTKLTGSNALKITVETGTYDSWELFHVYDSPQNWSTYDFFTFYMNGVGDDTYYVFYFIATNGVRYRYEWQDSWIGWKKVMLPLKMKDGMHEINEVNIRKKTSNSELSISPSWDKIETMIIALSSANPNNQNTLYLDRFGLDVSQPSQKTLSVDRINWSTNEAIFPVNIPVYPLIEKAGTDVSGWYNGKDGKIPFASNMMVNETKFIYLNVYPIIQKILSDKNCSRNLYPILGSLMSEIDIGLLNYNKILPHIFDQNSVIFKGSLLEGAVNVFSSSIIFPDEMKADRIAITIDGHPNFFSNVTSLLIKGHIDNVTVLSPEANTLQGKGFYASVTAKDPNITIKGIDLSVSLVEVEGGEVCLYLGPIVELSAEGDLDMYLRTPSIRVEGQSTFSEMTSYGALQKWLKNVHEQELIVMGNTQFSLSLSDTYTVATAFEWDGQIERDPPLLLWAELDSQYVALLWFIPLSLFIFIWKKIRHSNKKSSENGVSEVKI